MSGSVQRITFCITNLWGLLMVITSTTQWAGWKDRPSSRAAVLSIPRIHGNSSLICGFNHGFQNPSLFMTLTFTLTVNGKHWLGSPDRRALRSSKPLVGSTVILYISIFLPTHPAGDRAGGGVGEGARLYTVWWMEERYWKMQRLLHSDLRQIRKGKKGCKTKPTAPGVSVRAWGALFSYCSKYLRQSSNTGQHYTTFLMTALAKLPGRSPSSFWKEANSSADAPSSMPVLHGPTPPSPSPPALCHLPFARTPSPHPRLCSPLCLDLKKQFLFF